MTLDAFFYLEKQTSQFHANNDTRHAQEKIAVQLKSEAKCEKKKFWLDELV
jgi:hypothetical protein